MNDLAYCPPVIANGMSISRWTQRDKMGAVRIWLSNADLAAAIGLKRPLIVAVSLRHGKSGKLVPLVRMDDALRSYLCFSANRKNSRIVSAVLFPKRKREEERKPHLGDSTDEEEEAVPLLSHDGRGEASEEDWEVGHEVSISCRKHAKRKAVRKRSGREQQLEARELRCADRERAVSDRAMLLEEHKDEHAALLRRLVRMACEFDGVFGAPDPAASQQ